MKPPRSVGDLERLVRAYVRRTNVAEKRVRDWIAYMAIGGVLERAGGNSGSLFTFRGGIALELRRRGAGRATKDLDLTYSGSATDLVLAIEEALAPGYERFTFQRTGKPFIMPHVNTARIAVAVRFDGEPWTKVAVDVSPKEEHVLEVEAVPAFDLQDIFGVTSPETLPCLSLRYHVAHKLHGMTAVPDDGRRNERVQDAIDVLLLREMVTDLPSLRAACVDVFTTRRRHRWPPRFEPPVAWVTEFARMAEEVGLEVRQLEQAVELLRGFIAAIEARPARGTTITPWADEASTDLDI